MRLVVRCRDLDLARPLGGLARDGELARGAEKRKVGGGERAVVGLEAGLGGAGEHRMGAGVGVLHVEDRVVLRLLHHLVEVEVERGVVLAGEHDEAGDVGADLLDDVAQRDEGAGALGHLEGLAALVEADELAELHVERHAVVTRGRRRRPSSA